jgi:tetratricopeptide (TPR) repeat protein
MRSWAASVVDGRGPSRRRLADLAGALRERGWQHRDDLTLPAAEAFARGEGDCVSFAFVLAALARSRGLSVVFVIRGPGAGERHDGLVVGRGHLAVGLAVRRGLEVYDLAGEPTEGASFLPITDRQAIGVYHSNRGSALLLVGRPPEAVVELSEATAVAPDLADAWTNLGVALLRSGRPAEAERAYRRAVQLAPESAGAWRNLALLLERKLGLGAATLEDASR